MLLSTLFATIVPDCTRCGARFKSVDIGRFGMLGSRRHLETAVIHGARVGAIGREELKPSTCLVEYRRDPPSVWRNVMVRAATLTSEP